MIRQVLIACFAAALFSSPALAEEHSRKKARTADTQSKKTDTAASCKMPAVGPCPSCAITCRPAETAMCGPGQVAADSCVKQPTCSCSVR